MNPGSLPLSRLAALGALVCLVACSTAPDKRLLQYLNTHGFGKRYTGNAEEENYVTIGDTVQMQDAYHNELNQANEVEIDGTIVLPELGAVAVAGLTRTDLESLLTEKYSPYYEQLDIKVRIRTSQGSKQYFVFGEVGNEGARQFGGDLTLFEAVMEANPTQEAANLGRVRLIRADPRDPLIIIANLETVFHDGDSTFSGIHVQENDIIYVPPTMLGALANFLKALIYPVTEVVSQLRGALVGGGRGRGRRGGYGGGGGLFGGGLF